MSLYDLIYEEDASGVYAALSGAVGQSQNAGDQHISFSAHLRRADNNHQPPNTHELVHFLGYISKYLFKYFTFSSSVLARG